MSHASSRPRRPLFATSLALAAAVTLGCESEINLVGSPARPLVGEAGAVRAILAPGAAGTVVTIDDPSGLPAFIREARDLKVAVGGQTAIVARPSAGHYTFTLPANTRLDPDVTGHLKVLFVANERDSQLITLHTGNPLQFGSPLVTTEPSPAFLVRGMKVRLVANTPISTDRYELSWSASTTGLAPWQPIPGDGRTASWTPAQAGNYFIRIEAVDRQTRQAHSVTTPSAVVFVAERRGIVTTTPASGAVSRGQVVRLAFQAPQGFEGDLERVTWSYAASPQGPWTAITGAGSVLEWMPTALGAWYLKAEAVVVETGEVASFVSPEAAVFVSEPTGIIAASPSAVERGDRVGVSLNAAVAPGQAVAWFYSRTGGSALGTAWTPMLGSTADNDLVVNEAGTYSFRADLAGPGGAVRTFTTNEPIVTVTEGNTPLITTDPPNNVIARGSSVLLRLNARGVDEDRFSYLWYYTANPVAGWTALTQDSALDARRKSYLWETERNVFGSLVQVPAGSYFIRVDATELVALRRTYTFTSTSPVVTIENP
ncbi:MAG: hypothetical protein VKS61_08845 [Candidatus Sericytochromatia bacterium]|nr:hypothetical protein [Candidatus Sericytochromatia bacterium]